MTSYIVRKFDGDEMNLHMPQDPESEAELKNLAAVPYQIISPANNSSIIGIYQDSMLGSYLFSRENGTNQLLGAALKYFRAEINDLLLRLHQFRLLSVFLI